ncbi:MAG: MaoC family dehydratase [Actinomycetota bacterium]|nr:MaoC family dehydratase [Actinomycetota bacterium]
MADVAQALEQLNASLGERRGPGEWILVDQQRIDTFADATEDHQWIHVDVEKAKTGPFGGPIGHGWMSAALIPALASGLVPREGFAGGINYGANKIRFPQPLPVDTRVRAYATLVDVQEHPMGIMITQKVEVEGEGLPKPVCVAETLALLFV